MAFDGITVSALVAEIDDNLKGGRINKIAQPENDELLQDSSNIMMKATMKVANDYLKKNLNLTMKDLGFTAYK